ncbi:MAG: XTP/dITP diphosphatase, partial [Sarcina sp.]
SNNAHKIEEIKNILKGFPFKILSLKEKNIDIDVEEDGNTFEENSKKKAVEIVDYLKSKGENNFLVMADDSGLEVDALMGAPGIYSARYAGEHGNTEANNEKLLKELVGIKHEKRTAKFVCVITVINSEYKELVIRGEVKGLITEELFGKTGFGYDPLFYIEEYNKTFAELSSEDKNKISHRGKALDELKNRIQEII